MATIPRAVLLAAAAAHAWEAHPSGPPPAGPACKDCPNIVLLLTDDQDEGIGGWDHMSQTERLIQARGVYGTEYRIHTPICAPSRAEMQSGRYYTNIVSKKHTPPRRVAPSGSIQQLDLAKVWPHIFPTTLRAEKGYTTAMFGKCMNGECGVNLEGGFNSEPTMNLHQMGAFDVWFEGTGYQNGEFYDNRAKGCAWPWNSTACSTKVSPGGEWAGRGDGYLTSTLSNLTVEWIHEVAGQGRPFFVYFAPHAPHSPAKPPRWYRRGTVCDTMISPRIPNYNYSGVHTTTCTAAPPTAGTPWWWGGTDFHELVSCQPPYSEADAAASDALQRNRCRTLLAVDDAYAAIIKALKHTDTLENTYLLVTSDHGYNLGHHRLPSNKFLIYEHSLKVPFVASGPGIPHGKNFTTLSTQVDIAPTILGLAGIDTPAVMDGRSLVRELVTAPQKAGVPESVRRHVGTLAPLNRTSTFHAYFSQGPFSQKSPTWRPLDDWSNTYIGVTYSGPEGRFKYAKYDPYGKQSHFSTPYMHELFDMTADPYELHNIYNATLAANPDLVAKLTTTLHQWYACRGQECP